MYARIKKAEPHTHSEETVKEFGLDAGLAAKRQEYEQSGGYKQEIDVYVGAVEKGDHKYAADIVGYG